MKPDGRATRRHRCLMDPIPWPVADLRRIGAHPDHWYPLAWSHEVKPRPGARRPIRRRADRAGAEQGTASVFALEDRCAHRQVPLHKGVVDGGAIRCCYHGWTYDRTGRCIDVPYLGKGHLPNGVRAYPCREAEGLVFVFPGDAGAGRVAPVSHARLRRRPRLQDPALRQAHRLPLHVHAREPDGHEPPVPAPGADGPDPPALPRTPDGRGLAGDRLHLRPRGRRAVAGRARDLRQQAGRRLGEQPRQDDDPDASTPIRR